MKFVHLSGKIKPWENPCLNRRDGEHHIDTFPHVTWLTTLFKIFFFDLINLIWFVNHALHAVKTTLKPQRGQHPRGSYPFEIVHIELHWIVTKQSVWTVLKTCKIYLKESS